MPSGPVAVIDIGSNSIKILVATRRVDGGITPRHVRTIDARISAGISQTRPRLSPDGIARGIDAIRTLLADAAGFAPAKTILVATSAVRDAINGGEFAERVRLETGQSIRILSGEEEANLIGRGLTADPALHALRDFYVFDLGGGSLECLAFANRTMAEAVSLRLGCVRLTEKFVPNPDQPISAEALAEVHQHTRAELSSSSFRFALPQSAVAVGTGGTVTTVRAILGARVGQPFEATDPNVTIVQLRELLSAVAALPLAERKRIAGLPPPRADVFPVALATLIAVAERGGFSAFTNSVYNLRYGLAAEALAKSWPASRDAG
jgi:exopolyphosphatase / guanosine-5'-triphosphate,3'-diphosphate pyrophosphatase